MAKDRRKSFKAWVLYDERDRPVPSTLVLRNKKPAPGDWREALNPYGNCCVYTTTTSTSTSTTSTTTSTSTSTTTTSTSSSTTTSSTTTSTSTTSTSSTTTTTSTLIPCVCYQIIAGNTTLPCGGTYIDCNDQIQCINVSPNQSIFICAKRGSLSYLAAANYTVGEVDMAYCGMCTTSTSTTSTTTSTSSTTSTTSTTSSTTSTTSSTSTNTTANNCFCYRLVSYFNTTIFGYTVCNSDIINYVVLGEGNTHLQCSEFNTVFILAGAGHITYLGNCSTCYPITSSTTTTTTTSYTTQIPFLGLIVYISFC